MELPWSDAGRALEGMGAQIRELIPPIWCCVSYGPEGVRLRLWLPFGAVRYRIDRDTEGKLRMFVLEYPPTGALVNITSLLRRLECFVPLIPRFVLSPPVNADVCTLDLNLVAPATADRKEG